MPVHLLHATQIIHAYFWARKMVLANSEYVRFQVKRKWLTYLFKAVNSPADECGQIGYYAGQLATHWMEIYCMLNVHVVSTRLFQFKIFWNSNQIFHDFVLYFLFLIRWIHKVVQSRQCNVAHTFMRCENVLSTIRRTKHTLWVELIEKGTALSVKIYWEIRGNHRHSAIRAIIRSGRWSRYELAE